MWTGRVMGREAYLFGGPSVEPLTRLPGRTLWQGVRGAFQTRDNMVSLAYSFQLGITRSPDCSCDISTPGPTGRQAP